METVRRPDTPPLVTLRVDKQVVGTFRSASRPPLWAFVEFAAAARDGITTEDMAGLAAIYDLIEASVDPRDWPAFRAACRKHQPGPDDLLAVVSDALAQVSKRPTLRPAVSSAGPRPTGGTSMAGSSSPGMRPDLAKAIEGLVDVDSPPV